VDASTIIALVALVVSILFGAYNVFALRQEREDRKRQFELNRRQVEAEVEERAAVSREREAQTHAEITAAQGQSGHGSPFGQYEFVLKNLGPSWAKHVSCWLANSAEEALTAKVSAQYLERGQERAVTLEVPETVWRNPPQVHLMVEWRDESGGPNQERSNLRVAL
jgi:hypothetical protein